MKGFDKQDVVILYLREPKERIWGVLLALEQTGLTLRGLPIDSFDDWVREISDGAEQTIDLTTNFFPMYRIERMIMDESVGAIPSLAKRFEEKFGADVIDFLNKRNRE
jgi:hypothetical protein